MKTEHYQGLERHIQSKNSGCHFTYNIRLSIYLLWRRDRNARYENGGDENVREPFLWSSIQSDNYRTKWRNPLFSTESSVRPLELQRNDKIQFSGYMKNFLS